MSPSTRDEITAAIHGEVAYAESRYGPFASTHEGFGVLAEEIAELLAAIQANDGRQIIAEAVQVSAVAARIAMALEDEATRARSGVTE